VYSVNGRIESRSQPNYAKPSVTDTYFLPVASSAARRVFAGHQLNHDLSLGCPKYCLRTRSNVV